MDMAKKIKWIEHTKNSDKLKNYTLEELQKIKLIYEIELLETQLNPSMFKKLHR